MTFLATNGGAFALPPQEFTYVRFGQARATADSRFAELDPAGVRCVEDGRYAIRLHVHVDADEDLANVALRLWLIAHLQDGEPRPAILGTYAARANFPRRRLEPKATLEVDLVAGDVLYVEVWHDAGYLTEGRFLVLEAERVT